jgi:DNA-binding PadR family transcriptional regulator
MRRGAIRAGILLVLAEAPGHGYEVMNELSERSGGMWRPSPGSVYPTLQQLEDEGLVRAEEVEGKRVFSLTDAGRAEAAKLAEGGAPWDMVQGGRLSSDERALYRSALQLSVAASQVAQAGTAEQIAAAQVALDDARKRIYRLLAEDAPAGGATAP